MLQSVHNIRLVKVEHPEHEKDEMMSQSGHSLGAPPVLQVADQEVDCGPLLGSGVSQPEASEDGEEVVDLRNNVNVNMCVLHTSVITC